jgi:hypothetical protein
VTTVAAAPSQRVTLSVQRFSIRLALHTARTGAEGGAARWLRQAALLGNDLERRVGRVRLGAAPAVRLDRPRHVPRRRSDGAGRRLGNRVVARCRHLPRPLGRKRQRAGEIPGLRTPSAHEVERLPSPRQRDGKPEHDWPRGRAPASRLRSMEARPARASGCRPQLLRRELLRYVQVGVSASGLVATDIAPRRSFAVSSNWRDGALATASTESVTSNPNRCSPSRTRIPLVPRGLEGGSVGQSRRSFDCETPSRVLPRLRAVFAATTAFADDRTWGYRQLVARGEVSEGAVAVRTQAGRPLAYASLAASGGVRLFVVQGCVDDS